MRHQLGKKLYDKYKVKSENNLARILNDGQTAYYVEFFFHDIDKMETI